MALDFAVGVLNAVPLATRLSPLAFRLSHAENREQSPKPRTAKRPDRPDTRLAHMEEGSGQLMQSAVCSRRAAKGLPEGLVETAERAEARAQRDLQDRVIGGHQQPLRI
jgi:hypothetical protein